MFVELSFLKQIADVAAEQTLPRFRNISLVDNKYQTGFDPVTEADREAERAIRRLINASFPEHGILGEEFGGENLDQSHVWVIDPIDGTRAFISGIPVWGTLAGLTIDGDAVAGLMAQPFTKELFMCDGEASWYEGPGGTRRLETRKTIELSEATLFTTTPALFKDEKREAYDRVEQTVRLARYGTDCYAYAMLAAGFVDLVVETGLHPYDIVALIPIIEKAGGVITMWDGGAAEKAGNILAAATPELHARALDLLNR
ncbi:histidinol-phosphatase [Phyllobacterium brassicacearum]|uniref:Histidinol-phosphatase n=1 Tax=Phyllobacterium brassicacearum TaxID=314235 RepID=A0A2P7AK24_9HYPH|nr:histidinol-phosphatase [Phyllobacterium brassicacearum]PSH54550.1 histidinol-phosphatase [Phyllobacterium brassicacearum]TDQ20365.1 histidinol phosphatase-like enzyme (inositol monophosphatase family) [Phyllobacterium brassicacearum]